MTSVPVRNTRRRAALALLLLLGSAALGSLGAVIVRPELALIPARAAARWRYGARSGVVHVPTAGSGAVDVAWSEVGEGRPVLLVHGLGGESTALLPLARELARHGYRAVVLDLPGCGRSPRPPRPLGIDSAGAYALGAAEALGLGPRPALVGHSLGGWIVAWQALARPDRCGPVVLSAAAGLAFEPPPLNELMPRTVADGRRNVERLFADPPWIPAPLLWLAVKRPRPANFDLLRSAMSGDFLLDGLLPGLDVPVLVLAASSDGIVPPETARAMAAAIPDARYVEIRNASHMLIWEQPREVADAIHAFLAAHPVDGPARGGLVPQRTGR